MYRSFYVTLFLCYKFPIIFLWTKLSSVIGMGKILNLTLLHSEFVEGEQDDRTDEISSFNRFTCV